MTWLMLRTLRLKNKILFTHHNSKNNFWIIIHYMYYGFRIGIRIFKCPTFFVSAKNKVFCFRNDLEKIRPSQISCVMNGSGHGSLEMLGQTIVAHNMCRGLSYLLVESCSKSISTHKASKEKNQWHISSRFLLACTLHSYHIIKYIVNNSIFPRTYEKNLVYFKTFII